MSEVLSPPAARIDLGAYFRLKEPSGAEIYYRLGHENDPKTEPKTIGIDSTWGTLLRNRKVGDEVTLPVEECNIATCAIKEVRT